MSADGLKSRATPIDFAKDKHKLTGLKLKTNVETGESTLQRVTHNKIASPINVYVDTQLSMRSKDSSSMTPPRKRNSIYTIEGAYEQRKSTED